MTEPASRRGPGLLADADSANQPSGERRLGWRVSVTDDGGPHGSLENSGGTDGKL